MTDWTTLAALMEDGLGGGEDVRGLAALPKKAEREIVSR